MSRFSQFWFAAIAIFVAHSAQAEASFPTAVGTTWEYQVADSSAAGTHGNGITVSITGKQQVEGKDAFVLETKADDVLRKTEVITADERGVFCLRRSSPHRAGVSFEHPQPLIPGELKVGSKCELEDEGAGNGAHQQFTVAAQEDLAVPAGTFHAFRLECEEPWPISIAIQRWFAPGVGLIKDITTTRGPTGRLLSRVTVALKEFRPARVSPPNEKSPASAITSVAPLPPAIAVVVAKTREGEAAAEFRSDAPNIFVRWTGEHLPVESAVRVAWIAEDVGDVAPPNFVIDAMRTTVSAPESGAQFTLSRPKDGWASGKYRIELYLDDKLMQTAQVTIVD